MLLTCYEEREYVWFPRGFLFLAAYYVGLVPRFFVKNHADVALFRPRKYLNYSKDGPVTHFLLGLFSQWAEVS